MTARMLSELKAKTFSSCDACYHLLMSTAYFKPFEYRFSLGGEIWDLKRECFGVICPAVMDRLVLEMRVQAALQFLQSGAVSAFRI